MLGFRVKGIGLCFWLSVWRYAIEGESLLRRAHLSCRVSASEDVGQGHFHRWQVRACQPWPINILVWERSFSEYWASVRRSILRRRTVHDLADSGSAPERRASVLDCGRPLPLLGHLARAGRVCASS